jgi:hypothetical protein
MLTEMSGDFNHRKLFDAKLRISWDLAGNKNKLGDQRSGAAKKLNLLNQARGEFAHCELNC